MPKTKNAGKIKYYNLSEPQMWNGWKNRREKRA